MRAALIAVLVTALVVSVVFIARMLFPPRDNGVAVPVSEKAGFVSVNHQLVPYRQLPNFGQAAFVRATDPCGFIAPDPIRSLGAFNGFVHPSVNSCSFAFGPDSRNVSTGRVLFDTRGPDMNSSNAKYSTETMSGVPVEFEDGSLDCTASIKIDPPMNPAYTTRGDTPGITRPPSSVWLQITQSSTRAVRPGCDAVRTLSRSAAEKISKSSFPPRKPGPSTAPISIKDPCEVVAMLPPGPKLDTWVPSVDSNSNVCALTFDGGQAVNIVYTSENESTLADNRKEATARELNGRKVFDSKQYNGCAVSTTAGKPIPGSLGDESTLFYPVVQVGVAGPCESVDALLTAVATVAAS